MGKTPDKTLSKKDDVSLSESLSLISNFRKDMETGLIIPEGLKTERKKVCGYCGKPFDGQRRGIYFGEIFHDDCCKAMINGERNE